MSHQFVPLLNFLVLAIMQQSSSNPMYTNFVYSYILIYAYTSEFNSVVERQFRDALDAIINKTMPPRVETAQATKEKVKHLAASFKGIR